MLQVTDVRQTRVFQEALEEGREEGREEGIEVVALRLLKMGRPIAEIAQATGLTPAQIRKLRKKSHK
jgi:predicted transposase/invertase (TIGR01784 family)